MNISWNVHGLMASLWAIPRSLVPSATPRPASAPGLPGIRPCLLLVVPLLLNGCASDPPTAAEASACRGMQRTCAATDAQPGLRESFRGHRLVRMRWLNKANRESGAADIGIQADSQAIQLQR
jgi:hypothetical protein